MTIGKRIKKLREDLKMTQKDVAKKTGVAIQTIYKYEQEIVTNIPLDKIEMLATAFNVTPAYLMGWESKKATQDNLPEDITFDDFTYAMYNETKELTEEDKDALLNMARILKKKTDN